MPADLTDAELTLLGLLVEQPRHGYELEEVITARGMREWTEIGFSSIYYLLAKLRERGLIEESGPPRGGRGKARKVYAPTQAGRRACAQAAESAIAEFRPVFPPILVGLANQPLIPTARLRAALDRRAMALDQRELAVREAAEAAADAPDFVRAIFDYSRGQLAAERAWLSRYRAACDNTPTSKGQDPLTPYDVKRAHKELYAPKNTDWALVDVPAQQFIAVDGSGDPNTSEEYKRAVEALYAVAYTLKFAGKREGGRDFVVAPLEGLWWADDPTAFTSRAKAAWHWTMLISLPDWVNVAVTEEAKHAALAKKKLPTIAKVSHHRLAEGNCAQALHIGSYDDEGPLLARLHGEYLEAHNLRLAGPHHEIYLSDPRRVEPAKLRTVLRQPVAPVS
jgi:DNA-binding PadR family transcriptional regulator